jgi:RND family efflux transporter MFP subunit
MRRRSLIAAALLAVLAVGGLWWLTATGEPPVKPPDSSGPKPALTVEAVSPQAMRWPRLLAANGNIAAWQEAVIGAEISNYRLTEVLVNVGDTVAKGQLLARIADDNIAADLAQSEAGVAEAEANLTEARFNAERARRLRAAGFYSPQQAQQSDSAEQAAKARLQAARARRQASALRMAQTQVRAPDAGVVSARAATVGSLTQQGQELFRLIRGGRLEWRAEVTGAELGRLQPGTTATITTASGTVVTGRVRALAPTVDPATRNALVYVDLPGDAADKGARAGTFARGQFELGDAPALTLPQSAVVLRDGFSYVFRLADNDKVLQTKVETGRRLGERVEILAGLDDKANVVASGAGFLADGDTVRIVTATGRP